MNALAYVMYNTRLRERSIRRRQNIDPIQKEEIDSDDEWITEREDPAFSNDTSWLDDAELFNADTIRTIPANNYNQSLTTKFAINNPGGESSSASKRRKVLEISIKFAF